MFKLIILVLSLKIIAFSCDKSFTVVLDTTDSMSEELNLIKANIGQVVNNVSRSDISNYILVPFKDTVVESPYITESSRYFTSRLNTITTSGGSDCPENSLAGIEAALRVSNQESYIFVFTDAYAKDYDRFRSIEALCRESHSQVIIFLSGFCLPSRTSTVDVYYDVARTCSGSIFRFDTPYELRQAFSFMKEVLNTEWTDITTQETFTNHKELSFTVDTFITDFLIGVSGNNPTLNILEAGSQRSRTLNRVLFTRHALVVHLNQPDPGQYSVSIRGQGKVVVTYYERNYIPFEFGFSTKRPRSLMETSSRPMPGSANFVLISVDTQLELESIEWLNSGESSRKVIYLQSIRPGLYVSSPNYVEPGKTFRIWIIGQDAVTQQRIRGSSKHIFAQEPVTNVSWVKPHAKILQREINLIDYGTEMILACRVNGYPRPSITWNGGNGELQAENILLEIPSLYISYLTIANVTDNSTYSCKTENAGGSSEDSMDIFVNRTFSFDVIKSPEDKAVEYGKDLSLYCQVIAYPEATVEWYYNNSKLDFYSNPKITIQDDTLIVSNVSIEDGGAYECRASNGVESRTFTATVEITGLEKPSVELKDTEMFVKPGDWVEIECRITKGKPAAIMKWQFKDPDAEEYKDLTGVIVDGGKVKISSAEKHHGGTYRCSANNVLGEDLKDVTVYIQYAPTFKNSEHETLTVKEEDSVELLCDVDAVPEASIRWEMNQDDVIIPLGERHITDEYHTLRFTAYGNDSGSYHCIAHNDVGRAERTVALIVLVPPYIETPRSELIISRKGGQVDLACNVLYGSPAPRIKWKFFAIDSRSMILSRDKSTLHLQNVTQNDEGSYMCIAENDIGIDRIKYSLKVQQ